MPQTPHEDRAFGQVAALSDEQVVTGNTAHTRPENRAFYPALDGLRAIAFLMVFYQHYTSMPWGWAGVNIFFVLSGFLITGILFDARDDPHRARNFYIRRTLRIFPLYYGIFLGLLALQPVFHWHWNPMWLAWPLYVGNFLRFRSPETTVTGSQQEMVADAHLASLRLPHTELYLGHFWSLCVEEQFYLAWPWIVFWLRDRRKLLWLCGSVVVLTPLVRVFVQHKAPAWMLKNELLYRATPFQLDALLLGGMIALLWRGVHREKLVFVARIVVVILILFAAAYLANTVRLSDLKGATGYRYPTWVFTWGLLFINVLSAALIIYLLQPTGWLQRFFSMRPLRWVGRISYGAYVLHDILHDLYVHVVDRLVSHHALLEQHSRAITANLGLACTLFMAWLSFRFFEARFLNLKERWTIRGAAQDGYRQHG